MIQKKHIQMLEDIALNMPLPMFIGVGGYDATFSGWSITQNEKIENYFTNYKDSIDIHPIMADYSYVVSRIKKSSKKYSKNWKKVIGYIWWNKELNTYDFEIGNTYYERKR